jgi:hypothetical protein
MLTPQEILEIRRWHPDEIKKHAHDTLTFMWSPTGGLFVGWPMDHDPTRPGRRLPPGQPFRPNHAEITMLVPNFAKKFFAGRPDLLATLNTEPWTLRESIDEYGLSGRVGRGIVIAGRSRTVCGLWPSPNHDKYLRRCQEECRGQLELQPDDIIHPLGSEPRTLRDVLD